ncbi:MAG TPA: DNA alkylation repair protein [Candidatus Evtepia faecigallinarum]|nr:DNA alkylation repair protein [Candidatus Evtepia faecigallinarum]
MTAGCQSIRETLVSLADPAYRAFHSKLMPTVDPEKILGVRVPQLRKLAKELTGTQAAAEFLRDLPHGYYDEDNLHGFLIAAGKDFTQVLDQLDRFLPYVDNWATCDLISPKVFKKHLPELEGKIPTWLAAEAEYTVRFGLGTLLGFYLDDAFRPEHLEWAAALRREEYYIRMMVAWYFATALAKQYGHALPYLEEGRLDLWTHNKTIQKAVESTRVCPEHKAHLRTLRRKKDSLP